MYIYIVHWMWFKWFEVTSVTFSFKYTACLINEKSVACELMFPYRFALCEKPSKCVYCLILMVFPWIRLFWVNVTTPNMLSGNDSIISNVVCTLRANAIPCKFPPFTFFNIFLLYRSLSLKINVPISADFFSHRKHLRYYEFSSKKVKKQIHDDRSKWIPFSTWCAEHTVIRMTSTLASFYFEYYVVKIHWDIHNEICRFVHSFHATSDCSCNSCEQRFAMHFEDEWPRAFWVIVEKCIKCVLVLSSSVAFFLSILKC